MPSKSTRLHRPWRLRMRGGVVITVIVAVGLIVAVPGGVIDTWYQDRARGTPDPGHALLTALRPVAAVVPSGVKVLDHEAIEPRWDSCDGRDHGWDPVTVDVGFDPHGLSDSTIFNHINDALLAEGWATQKGSETGAWYWERNLGTKHLAVIQLLGGSTNDPPSPWDLQATTPALTHQIGC